MIIVDDEVCHWVCKNTCGQFFGGGIGIGLTRNDELIAGVMYDHFIGNSIRMHVASDGSKKWLNREFLRVCFDYPFRQLKVKKVLALIDSTNEASLKFSQHLGFVKEATLAECGRKGDLVILSMTREQCKHLGE